MKGVVRPQAMPTRRKPRVHRKMEGEGEVGTSGSMVVMVGNDEREFRSILLHGYRVGGSRCFSPTRCGFKWWIWR